MMNEILTSFFFDRIYCYTMLPTKMLFLSVFVIEEYKCLFRAYLDCHLMVANPLDYVEPLGKAGASGFTFHVEVSKGG